MTVHSQICGFRKTINSTLITAAHVSRLEILCDKSCVFANARIKVSRYNARGIIQMSGIEATSVEMCVVTPSIKLDGISAKPTQSSRLIKGIRSMSIDAAAPLSALCFPPITNAQSPMSTASNTYPVAQ